MANYVQWAASKKIGRSNWVYGPEEILKLEVANFIRSSVSASEFDYICWNANTDDELIIWHSVFSKSLTDGCPVLIEIANAGNLSNLGKLKEWLSEHSKYSPNTTLLLIADDDPPVGLKPPKSVQIKCVMPKASDRLSWAKELGGLSTDSAKRLLEYKNGELAGVRDICLKLNRLLPGATGIELTLDTLETLDEQEPYGYADAMLAGDKPLALLAASKASTEDIGHFLGYLYSSVGLVEKLKRHLEQLPRGAKLDPIPGFPMARVTDLAPVARASSYKDLVRRRQAIVLVESYARQGISDGVLEMLVSLW